jgi:uncharacterized protein (DUF1810 family)
MALERFTEAQASSARGYRSALAELQAGGKQGHWIWYVFPQLAGLGRSSMSRRYALRDVDEALAYARDPVLGRRLLAIATVAAQQLARGVSLEHLMGSDVDALKLVSSMTLFEWVAARLPDPALAEVATQILAAAQAQGYRRCQHTLSALGA